LDAATQDPELWARPGGPYESDLRARWFVPIENVIGENPRVVLRSLMQPDQPGALSTGTAVGALPAYAAVCVAVIATVMATVM
jgi:hypothetical protein